MNGMKFPEAEKPFAQNSRTINKSNDLNTILKTATNFVDKNVEFAVPLNKGKNELGDKGLLNENFLIV
jgi:hypothetical protein